jgi:V/A-type H+-transporting ATPase subunit I
MLVPVKKLTLYALKADRDAILLALQKSGNVMLLQEGDKKPLNGAEAVNEEKEKAAEALRFLARNGVSKSLLAPRATLPYQQFLETGQNGEKVTAELDQLSNKISSLQNEAVGLRAQAETLAPWKDLDIPLEDLKDTAATSCFVGYVPLEEMEALNKKLTNLLVEINTLGDAPDGKAMVVIAYKSAAEKAKHFLKEHDFTEAILPKKNGLPQEAITAFNAEADAKDKEAQELITKAKSLGADKGKVELYYDQLSTKADRMAISGEETVKAFYMEGWVRHDKTAEVEKTIAGVTDAYQLDFRDPKPEEIPPSVLENNPLVRPYESVIDLYSKPMAGSIDPDFVMAPFHFIFFGMMLSDAGYGVVLTILLLIAMKLFKPRDFAGKLTMVIFFGSISTVIWGALFGGWFGMEWHPIWFVPLNEPLKMLILCYVLGALHILSGMLFKIYLMVRDGDIAGAFFDECSWLIMFAGFICMALVPGPIGKYLAWIGAGIIILFGGRAKKGIFRRLLGGLLTLYTISGYLSDILSYSRIFALGLATGVIAMVINTIGQMLLSLGPVGTVAAVIVVFLGHSFNIVINVLGAFVHSSRLQYIEFFGKFYESGGRAFLPLALRTKYTDVTK